MTGHVFHPGHSELHGVTVVLETGQATYVGRYHEETPKGILLHDVAEHGDPASRAAFIQKTLKFGVNASHKHQLVPTGEVKRLLRLVEWKE
jgi:hypothetical protein